MPDAPTRAAVLEAMASTLQRTLDVAAAQLRIARDEATNDETKQESRYDTRAIEAGYLAEAQSRRLAEVKRTLEQVLQIPVSQGRTRVDGPCLVAVRDEDDAERWYFVGPASGGLRVEVEGTLVRVVTPASPLGAALIGTEPGDEVLDAEGRTFEVVSIDGVGARAIEF